MLDGLTRPWSRRRRKRSRLLRPALHLELRLARGRGHLGSTDPETTLDRVDTSAVLSQAVYDEPARREWERQGLLAGAPALITAEVQGQLGRPVGLDPALTRNLMVGSKSAADQMWVARYILTRLCEKYEIDIEWRCKPILAPFQQPLDWNGSGMHTNFSTKYLREVGGKEYFEKLMAAFNAHVGEHIAVYGPENHLRLTGLHETQSIDKFSYGLSDRGASIRMPVNFIKDGYKGYLEDRRPNSAADPYLVAGRIIKTIQSVPTK